MKLSTHFSLGEFASKDGSRTPADVQKNLSELAENLQVLRDHFGTSITINSGYRSPAHNEAVGGSKNSQHIKGTAADIVVQNVSPDEVARAIEQLIIDGKMQQGGIGLYKSFTHYDIRGMKARWDFRFQN